MKRSPSQYLLAILASIAIGAPIGVRRRKPRRRHGLQSWYAPRRFEPESLLDAWPFLVCALLIAGGILWARSQGWLP